MRMTHDDEGFFGPGSVSWKVLAHPAALIGGLRALLIQTFHPLAMAGVAQYSDFRSDPFKRLRRTSSYVSIVTFGDRASARAAAAQVRRLHERVRGTDPVTGREFYANDPETMVWVHCTEVHSFTAAYRAYAGRLTRAERDRYLAEQVAAAEVIGIPRDMVPASVDGYRDYFASVLPELRWSGDAAATFDWVRRPTLPTLPPAGRLLLTPAVRVMGRAAEALVPPSLREIARLPEPGPRALPTGAVVAAAARIAWEAYRVGPLRSAIEAPYARLLGKPSVQAARVARVESDGGRESSPVESAG